MSDYPNVRIAFVSAFSRIHVGSVKDTCSISCASFIFRFLFRIRILFLSSIILLVPKIQVCYERMS